MSQVAKKWTLAKAFEGMPKKDDFKLVEEPISFSLKPGEFVIETLYLSVDPYMRRYPNKVGETLQGGQVGRVKVSRNPTFPEGTLVLSYLGWRTLSLVTNPDDVNMMGATVTKLPDFGDLPASLGLGCLGMPGLTAYFGLLDRGQPKAGEVVLVSTAAGASGSVVGQIAKIKGCMVIGSAGTKEKCDWVKELGFDHVFNYKETTVDEALKTFAPGGVDLHFDNVGGDFSFDVLQNHLKICGRVVSCGAISQYNSTDKKEQSIYGSITYKQLDIRGINVSLFKDCFSEALIEILQWVKEGKIKYRETITEGFQRMPEAFISLFQGGNIGKAIIKV